MVMQQEFKLNPKWILSTRNYFKSFLKETNFPHPVRNGLRGAEFLYPEWLIMFIAVLAVKTKTKSYKGIHTMSQRYWPQMAQGTKLPLISERQLRDRLKKISYKPGITPGFVSQIFPPHHLN
jgi:hypothetical protein